MPHTNTSRLVQHPQIVAIVAACGMTIEEFVTWNPVAEEMPAGPVLVTEDRTPWLQRRYA